MAEGKWILSLHCINCDMFTINFKDNFNLLINARMEIVFLSKLVYNINIIMFVVVVAYNLVSITTNFYCSAEFL